MFKIDIQKWNYKTREYDPYEVPLGWNITRGSRDMNLAINCASCGNDLIYGESFTSLELHDKIGFGYAVCGDCYALESDRRKEHEWVK